MLGSVYAGPQPHTAPCSASLNVTGGTPRRGTPLFEFASSDAQSNALRRDARSSARTSVPSDALQYAYVLNGATEQFTVLPASTHSGPPSAPTSDSTPVALSKENSCDASLASQSTSTMALPKYAGPMTPTHRPGARRDATRT